MLAALDTILNKVSYLEHDRKDGGPIFACKASHRTWIELFVEVFGGMCVPKFAGRAVEVTVELGWNIHSHVREIGVVIPSIGRHADEDRQCQHTCSMNVT